MVLKAVKRVFYRIVSRGCGITWNRVMRFVTFSLLTITLFVFFSQSLSEAIPVDGGLALDPNRTLLTGDDPPVGNSTLEQKGAAIVGNEAEEKKRSLAIFFILFVIVLATLIVHLLIITNFHYIPESLAIVILGATIGFVLSYTSRDWSEIEALSPDIFFLVLLPPIIFENAYNLNKGYFFSNIWPILTFAILGTALSSFVIGLAVYILGQASLVYPLTIFESFAFGSMISAVDPVATLAIFQAVKVEGLLYMLVFGESMLNDAVSIVLTATAIRHSHPPFSSLPPMQILSSAVATFLIMFTVSALLGAAIGLLSALLFKHVDLRRTPSLELALLMVFAYIPYGLAESLSLSGIMAILFCGITMSQYTQNNISPVTQITMRQTFRTVSFVAETSTFAYLGMAFFTIKLNFQPSFIFWSVVLCLVSRACNIFPLSWLVNKCRREVQISTKNQIIMWFSGMRGAVCFALALYLDIDKETKSVLLTTTLFLILFTIIFLGGSALPFINHINDMYPDKLKLGRKRKRQENGRERRGSESGSGTAGENIQMGNGGGRARSGSAIERRRRAILLSKTQEMSLFGSQDWSSSIKKPNPVDDRPTMIGNLMRNLFVRRFTHQEREEHKEKLRLLTEQALENDSWTDNGEDGEIGGDFEGKGLLENEIV
ncbi:unnamed protein product, partial [Mesorhabditis belari]|uniref:Sodium/hydrogen exchanger n=1 Tax=Mesorhabditis belari TaxID=2138241 RepID=A0AAF3F1V7_9BILA